MTKEQPIVEITRSVWEKKENEMKIANKVVKEQPKPNSEHDDGDEPIEREESKCCSCDSTRCKLWCIKSYHPTKVSLSFVWNEDNFQCQS